MIINLNFNIEAWVKNLPVEATSEEEAVQKLMGMSLAEIVEEGAIVDSEMKITEIDTSVEEYDATVEVTDIEYDLESEDMADSVKDYLRGRLPKELTFTIRNVKENEDLESYIEDEISYRTDYETKSFKFQILEKK